MKKDSPSKGNTMQTTSSDQANANKKRPSAKIWKAALVAIGALVGTYLFIRTKYPIINDISTDLNNPPAFFAAKEVSGIDPLTTTYPEEFRNIQRSAYPFVAPLAIGGDPQANYEKAIKVATEVMKWKIVATDAERLQFQALAQTPLLKFTDDIVVTIQGNEEQSIVNMRSRSRVGKGDFGANQKRITEFFRSLAKN